MKTGISDGDRAFFSGSSALEPDRLAQVVEQARRLNGHYAGASAREVVTAAIRDEFAGRIALVSSFGSNAAVLLHMVAEIDRHTPVLFLDTGRHFGETKRYRDALVERLGLADLRILHPDPREVEQQDPDDRLWLHQPDKCCFMRKVAPLQRALGGFDAWLNGRRRQQGETRAAIGIFEVANGRLQINPLFDWSRDDVDAHFIAHALPRHPLEEDGFRSIGCLTCTTRIAPGEDERAGRWRDSGKTECGIHLPIGTFKDFGADI